MNASAPSDPFAPSPRKARIEIIPLIDVIFFLLATFVLFTLSLEKIWSIEVPLPVGGEGEQNVLFLQASDAGTVFWQEGREAPVETLTLGELPPRLADYRQRAHSPRVLVRGDGKARFGTAIKILDEVRGAKIEQVSIETVPPR